MPYRHIYKYLHKNNSPVSNIRNSKDMGTQFPKICTLVLFHHVGIIKMWQSLKWIYSNQNAACVSLSATELLS